MVLRRLVIAPGLSGGEGGGMAGGVRNSLWLSPTPEKCPPLSRFARLMNWAWTPRSCGRSGILMLHRRLSQQWK